MLKRYAIYYAPDEAEPLANLGQAWLSSRSDEQLFEFPETIAPWLTREQWHAYTKTPRHYGFHGTLKAPFRLAPDYHENDLMWSLDQFTETQAEFSLPSISLKHMAGFFALVPAVHSAELQALAEKCVEGFDRFRAPMTPEERAKRSPQALTPRQRSLLDKWGYPYVFDAFRFHMTLTGAIDEDARERVGQALKHHFAPVLGASLKVNAVTLFCQPSPAEPFYIRERFRFRNGSE